MSIEVVVQSSSISSIENNNPTRNRNRNRNTSSNDGLYQSHTSSNNICNTTTTLVQEEEEEEEEEVVGGGERKRRRRREQLQQEEEEEERENQLKFVGLLFTAFRRSVFGCSFSTSSSSSSCDIIKTGLISSSCSGSNTNTNKGGGGMEIGLPTNVRHVAHVTFDRFNGFLGLPVEFLPEIPTRPPSASTTVFGVSTNSMQLSFDTRRNSVPTILLLMQHRLYAIGGLQAEGIFRINPDNGREEHVRDQLNRGLIPDDVDVHCLAGLIKAWFRELPTGVLDCLSPEQVMESQTEEECFQLAKLLPPTEAALLDWAVNLMADVAQLEHLNKMNARNVAMVFAPNMTHMADPLTALMHAVQVMNFLKTLIERTLKEREDAILDSALDSYSRDPSGDNGCHTPLQTIHEDNNESDVDVGGVRSSSKVMNPGAADDDDDDVSSTDENINSSIIPGENHQSTVSNNCGEEEGKIVTSEDKKTKLCNKTKNYCRVGQSCTSKKGVRKSNEKAVIEVNKVGEKTKGSILGVTLRSERIEAWR